MASLSVTWFPASVEGPRVGAAPWLAAASFATVTQALMVPGLLPGMAQALSVSVAEAGQATTAFALAAALGALPIAVACRRLDGRRPVVLGLAGLAAVNLLCALASSLAVLLALRVLAGLLAAAVLPAAPALAASLASPSGRVRALAAVTFGSTGAFAIGLPAATTLAEAFGWAAAFAFAGALCGVAALVLAWRLAGLHSHPLPVPPPPKRGRGDGTAPSVDSPLSRAAGEGQGGGGATSLSALRSPRIATPLLLVVLAFTAVFATQAFLGPIAAASVGASPALLQAMIAPGAVLGVPIGAAVAERQPRRAPAILAGSLLAAALWQWGILAGGLHSPLLQAGQVVLASAALFAVSPVFQARLVAAAPQARSLVLAANFVAVSLGQAAGAGVGGLALDAAGLPAAGAMGVVAAAAMLVLATRHGRDCG